MKKERKSQIIDKIQGSLEKSNFGIITEYRGMKTADLLDLRKKLKDSGSKYEVMKNSLTSRAADKAGVKGISGLLKGPIAVAYTSGEPSGLAKGMTDYIRATKTVLVIKGGFLQGKAITAKDVTTITTLPSRQILLGTVLGTMQAPISRLVGQLNAPIQNMVGVLQARVNQLGG